MIFFKEQILVFFFALFGGNEVSRKNGFEIYWPLAVEHFDVCEVIVSLSQPIIFGAIFCPKIQNSKKKSFFMLSCVWSELKGVESWYKLFTFIVMPFCAWSKKDFNLFYSDIIMGKFLNPIWL